MKWARFRHDGAAQLGRLDGDEVLLHRGDLFGQPEPTGVRLPLADVTEWLTPCQPRTMLGLWNNFHALAEKNGWARPAEPLYFIKAPGSAAAHGQPIVAPAAEVGRIAYEGELAVVIGRTTRAVSVEAAPEHIFGYTCANDVTAMELLGRDPSFAQWTRAKGFDTFGVFGPCIETEFDSRSRHAAHPRGRPRAPELRAGGHGVFACRVGVTHLAGHDAASRRRHPVRHLDRRDADEAGHGKWRWRSTESGCWRTSTADRRAGGCVNPAAAGPGAPCLPPGCARAGSWRRRRRRWSASAFR